MDFLDLREPVSAWTHGAGLLLSLPVTLVLLWRSWDDPRKGASLLVFGLSLAACYGASALYHGARVAEDRLQIFRLMDHVGIFTLIAGTYTPIAWNLLRGRWRRATLTSAWLAAAVGASLHLSCGTLPPWLSTALYMVMGWGAVFCYAELARTWPHRLLRPILTGGVFYSVGAGINLLHWPNLWPGFLESHELFHLFVIAGSATHVWFMATVVLPKRPAETWPSATRGAFGGITTPHWATTRARLAPLLVWTREGVRAGYRLRSNSRSHRADRNSLRNGGLGRDQSP